jgi:4-amino-4-deoxy-L-arabinose transferase-like glycosyltransferase/membrane-associated phospholipid phosphatase
MGWLVSLDVALFRFINGTLSNAVFDQLMPFLSGNPLFIPALGVVATLLIWKGRARGLLCVLFLFLVVALGDPLVTNTLKKTVQRPRPFQVLDDARVPKGIGKTDSFSMPSGHAANWFAATTVAFVYFRRSACFLLPLACAVGVSRIYNGVHYPSDVVVGAVLGAGYAAALLWALEALWRRAGRHWFPLWWQRLPSLLNPDWQPDGVGTASEESSIVYRPSSVDGHWLRLGYIVIGALLAFRLGYLASGKIELTEDEAYQWLWSKHLALSYYSKPPMIAYTQFLGTAIWGDTEFGVRFFAPVIAAVLSLLLLRFLAREVNARAGFWLVLIATATPLLAAGSILMTVDPLSVLFWTAAMLSAWQAIQQNSLKHWLWSGLWLALGAMSKFPAVTQPLCWGLFFWLWEPARRQLRRPGPWLALGVGLLGLLPQIIWNQQNGWPTMAHLASRGGLASSWKPTLNFFQDLVLAEFGLLNPVFFIAAVWGAIAFWRRAPRDARLIYFFCLSAPLFIGCLLWTFRARVQPNWIAPAVAPLFCLMTIYWEARWQAGARAVKGWLTGGLLLAVALLHDTNLIGKIGGRPLSPEWDPLRRVRSWKATAKLVGEARGKLVAEGQAVFIIGDHYGITGLLSFYLPEARAAVPENPLVYYRSSETPENQFYFWPGYRDRKGQNAIYVNGTRKPEPAPERIQKEFATVTDLGIHKVYYRGRVFHQFQLFECRNQR